MLMSKIPLEELEQLTTQAKKEVTPGTKWRHYKGGEYVVQDIVVSEENNGLLVLYSPTKFPTVSFVRPLVAWQEVIDLPDVTVSRFTQI